MDMTLDQLKTSSPLAPVPVQGNTPAMLKNIGRKEISEAMATLRQYKQGKEQLDRTIVENEEWYKLRHWDLMRSKAQSADPTQARPEPKSAWLFNSLANKHADAMDNYPEANVLPRERGDEADAKTLSSILPVIFERNEYEQKYSDAWWYKLKNGTSVKGVFWNPELENGLGDIDIRFIDILNLFWEPGITDIQKSRHFFALDLVDNDALEETFPQLTGKLGGNTAEIKEYMYNDTVDNSNKSVVVDDYYKVKLPNGKTILHFNKFVTCLPDEPLYASENDPDYVDRGWYDHGKYPFVFDTLFPLAGSPAGFGYMAIMRDPQMYIDKLGQIVIEHAALGAKVRYMASENAGINETEFCDTSKSIVHVTGSLAEERIKPITVPALNAVYMEVMQQKIDELKETSGNRDFSQGSSASGVTAAAAIAALQEAGNKGSRDSIGGSYRAFSNENYFVIELIRQFYDEVRSFRITGEAGEYDFVDYNNANLKDQQLPNIGGTDPLYRRPVFDIRIKAQKRNPFSRMSQNELAKEFYGLGFFNPMRAQEALIALEMMDFEGKSKITEQVMQGQTLLNQLQQMQMNMEKMGMIMEASGIPNPLAVEQPQGGNAPQGQKGGRSSSGGNRTLASSAKQAQTPMTGYGEKLAARSVPSMNQSGAVGMK